MKKWLFRYGVLMFLALSTITLKSQDTLQIKKVMEKQMLAWNNFDIEGFMDGYWKSDSLKFISKNGVTYGWQSVLDNYKKSYDTKQKMGLLTFSELMFENIASADSYLVIGKWEVKQSDKVLLGYFTLLFKKINNSWKIVCDHTS